VSENEHHVTVVVSDLQGSTALAERLDPESLRYVLDQYFDELGAILESHGGRIEKRIGDAMVTVFGLPAPADDDAVRAVRAVAECQASLANLNERLERAWGVRLTNRTGVASGPIVFADAGAGHRVLAGAALELASRLEPVAPPLEALLAESTITEVGPAATTDLAGPVTLKNGDEVLAARLIAVEAASEGTDRANDRSADRCSACEEPLDVDAQPPWAWCPRCASPIVAGGATRSSRRTLTIVFADLHPAADSPGGPEARREAMVRAFEELRGVLEHHGATVEKFIGDAVMAVFGLARRREDDALRAVRAALEMQAAVERIGPVLEAELGVRLELRIGVNTGPVIAGDPRLGQRLVTGDAVNVAARLEQTAQLGQVVIGGLTRRLVGAAARVEELEPLTLKGKAEPVPAFRVDAVAASPSISARLELPLIGRDAELRRLLDVYQGTVEARLPRRIRIRGDTGVGKSRLVYEFIDRLPDGVRVLRGTCLSYGEGITFWPVIEIIQSASGVVLGGPGDARGHRPLRPGRRGRRRAALGRADAHRAPRGAVDRDPRRQRPAGHDGASAGGGRRGRR
jgi:class 3 adenylate cyclase